MTRPYVLDVSGYQPQAKYYNFWQNWKNRGVHGAIVKLSESTYYRNPYGAGQIAAAQHEGMQVSGYHFSRFRGNSQLAVNEANYAIATANSMGLPHGSVLVLDYEEKLGYRSSNTQAAIAFLNTVKSAGFTPVFYSYSGMAGLWDFEEIHRQTGAMLWIAAYPVMSGVTEPYMNYFPGISDHIGAWQFTDNFYGEHIDASVDLTGVFTQMTQQKITSGGNLDSVSFDGNGMKVSGWFASDKAQGKQYTYIILTTEDGKELSRINVVTHDRPDVAKTFPDIPGGEKSGFEAVFQYTSEMVGKKLHVIFRYTDDPAGNGNFVDYVSVLDLTKSAANLDNVDTVVFSNKLQVSGWFASDMSLGLDRHFLILYDSAAQHELQRIKYDPASRVDVQQAHPDIFDSELSGFSGQFDYSSDLVGHQLQVIARFSDDEHGEGNHIDYWFEPIKGPTMPVMDGKTTTEVICHEFSAEQITGGLIKLAMK
ncbi:gametolysin [Limosilactobacillus reuteri]|uniref:Lysozyme n=1 Tax=Limosilactobacillus reuteri TaxID=1598 RepID=A0A1Y2UJX2_LIMRT|nr:GH25 family lysozyme [Limosilactobacillus reuteri]OTA49907.1 gametolysin [Limosilactobacillus reuteri]OTA82219.1 gametolysin [Limosilactobacillus reuteri]OTA83325.1 gametolysin [Limosilactobacillus reuteri]